MDAAIDSLATCTRCGGGELRAARVRSAFWEGERLVVVEDIPALVCAACSEQFYGDSTAIVLDLLRGDGFPAERAKSVMQVPVFSFSERMPSREEP